MDMYVLFAGVMLRLRSDHSQAIFHDGRRWIRLENLSDEIGRTLQTLQTRGASAEALAIGLPYPHNETLFEFLGGHRLIRPNRDNAFIGTQHHRQAEYFSQFANDPAVSIAALRNSTVLLLGLGGVGSVVAQHLGAAGIGGLVAVDHDRVSVTDLNRQFCYAYSDIGTPKTTAMAAYLADHAPDVSVSVYTSRITTRQDLQELLENEQAIRMVACCADNSETQIDALVAEVCRDRGLSCAFAGLHTTHGFWGPLTVESEKTEAFRRLLSHSRDGWLDPKIPLSSTGHANTIVSALFAGDIIHHLAGCGPVHSRDRILSFDFLACGVHEVLSL